MVKPGSDGQMPPISGAGPGESVGRPDATPEIEGFKITGRLGEGGMGTVWRAVQLSTRREVALKLLGTGAFASEKDRARFEREVELTARLRHSNIAGVYDSGLHQGLYYYAMELIAGVPLDKYIEDHHLPRRQILELMEAVCKAVQHAHQSGVIHRDLKPSNILVTADGQPHVLDFGLAKAFLEGDSGLSVSGAGEALGTPAYMSPEQAAGRRDEIDTRSDVFSLGVILFRLLTGQSPHGLSGTRYQVLRRIAEEKVRRPRDVTKNINRELEALLLKALARHPKDRYASAGALGQDIENYLNREPLTAWGPTTAYFLRKRLWKYRGRVALVLASASFLVGIAVVSYIRIAHERAGALQAKAETERENYYYIIALADARIADSLMDQAEALLWSTPKDLRSWEWGRLMRARHQDLLTLKGHSNTVNSAAFSPDGKRVATGSWDETAKIWDAESGQQILTLRGHSNAVVCAAFSPDGKRVVTGSWDKTAKTWDAESGQEIVTLKGHSHAVTAAFSPDGKRIATASGDKTARVWDAETGREILRLTGHTDAVHSVAFSPDGKRVLTGSRHRTAKIWDSESGQEILTLTGHSDGLRSVAFSPDGKRLVTGSDDKTAKVWDAESGQEILTLKGHYEIVDSAAFSPDGKRVATGSWDRTAKIWEAETGEEILTLKGHSSIVYSVAFSPDGRRVVTGSWDNTAKIWDAERDQHVLTLKGHSDVVDSAAFSPDGKRVVTGSRDKTAKIWDVETCGEIMTLRGFSHAVAVAFSPDGRHIATASGDKIARIWDSESGQEVLKVRGHSNEVHHVAFSPDGKRLVTGSNDHTARIWEAESGREILTLKGHSGDISSVGFSPGGKRVATGSLDSTARIWDGESGREIVVLRGHSRSVRSVAFSPDGKRVATGSYDKTVKIWDAQSGQVIFTLRGHSREVTSVAFSPDGKRVVTGSLDDMAKVWDAESGREILTLKGHLGGVNCVAFSPDGKRLLTGSVDTTAKIWNGFDWNLSREELQQQKLEHYRRWLDRNCSSGEDSVLRKSVPLRATSSRGPGFSNDEVHIVAQASDRMRSGRTDLLWGSTVYFS